MKKILLITTCTALAVASGLLAPAGFGPVVSSFATGGQPDTGERAARLDAAGADAAAVPRRADAHSLPAVEPAVTAHPADRQTGARVSAQRATPGMAEDADTDTPTRATQVAAARAKMSDAVAALALAGGNVPADIVVSYAAHPELLEDGRVESLGGTVMRRYEVLELLAIRLPAGSLIDFALDDNVDRLSVDDAVRVTSNSAKATSNRPPHGSANGVFHGDNVNIAILDTGIEDHKDLPHGVRQYDFLNGAYPQPQVSGGQITAYNDSPRVDGYGHGTHVAGIISGSGSGSNGKYSGPAAGAKLLSLRVLDENGQGQMSDVMAALDWLLQYGDHFDIDVVNLSLGMAVTESNTTDPLVAAVERLWDDGIVVVVAAGNYGQHGYYTVTSPGNSRKVITVGSLTDNGTGDDFSDDYVSSFSSRGPTPADFVMKPDLVAPGNRIVSAIPHSATLRSLLPTRVVGCLLSIFCDDDYLEMSGTSMATPLVAATAALMLQKDPSLTPATVKARLMRSAHKLDESPVVAGAGLLDIEAALDETGTVAGDALSPLMVYDAQIGATVVQDTGDLWGDAVWGSGYLWTDGTGVEANGYLWTDGVMANGYLWTDGVAANGYLWTDGASSERVAANGYLWTDGSSSRAQSLFDPLSDSPEMLDDLNLPAP